MATSLNRRLFLSSSLAALLPASNVISSEHALISNISPQYKRIPIDKIRFNMAMPFDRGRVGWYFEFIRRNGMEFPLMVRRNHRIGYPGTRFEGSYYKVHGQGNQDKLAALHMLRVPMIPILCIKVTP